MPTYGASGQPAQSTFNYDSLVATSLGNYRKTLIDNVSTTNVVFYELKNKGLWEGQDGGLFIAQDLMYALGSADSYDGMDELSLAPSEGITQVQYQWRQGAAPIAISEKERKMNKHRIVDLVAAKIQQAEMGFMEFWGRSFLQGSYVSGGTSLLTPYTSPNNGSLFMDPLPLLVQKDPTASSTVANLNQSSYSWWQNQTKQAAATTTTGLLQEIMNITNTCTKGVGGEPDIYLCDQTTWEWLNVALYNRYKHDPTEGSTGEYPFQYLKWNGKKIVWDQYMGDAYSDVANTTTYGTMYLLNSKFLRVVYENETNFVSTDFMKPVNQDAKYKHILWMGNTTISNRKKQGVYHKIPRTFTIS